MARRGTVVARHTDLRELVLDVESLPLAGRARAIQTRAVRTSYCSSSALSIAERTRRGWLKLAQAEGRREESRRVYALALLPTPSQASSSYEH